MAYEGYNLLSVSSENQLMFPEDIPFLDARRILQPLVVMGSFLSLKIFMPSKEKS